MQGWSVWLAARRLLPPPSQALAVQRCSLILAPEERGKWPVPASQDRLVQKMSSLEKQAEEKRHSSANYATDQTRFRSNLSQYVQASNHSALHATSLAWSSRA
jgi:hypothetical protein